MGWLRRAAAGLLVGILALGMFGGGCQESDCEFENDHNPCTTDECDGSHQKVPDGWTCHVHDHVGACLGGVCFVPCASDEDCDDKNACTTDICAPVLKTCIHGEADPVPQLDFNPCTWAGCLSTGVIFFPLPNWTPCNQGGECMDGLCSSCTTDFDCGKDTPCATYKCVSGVCKVKYFDKGEKVFSGDLKGDCQELACDGSGGIEKMLDMQDEPEDDDNPCTIESCAGWTPVHTRLDEGTFCPGGVCSKDGSCVECTENLHCGQLYCYANSCYSCENGVQDGDETGIDCGGSCGGLCLGEPCTQGTDCMSGFCVDEVCCNSSCIACFACNLPGSVGVCDVVSKYQEDFPLCTLANDQMCNGMGVCKKALSAPCASNFDCASLNCKKGICDLP